jgi:hypothetical protein
MNTEVLTARLHLAQARRKAEAERATVLAKATAKLAK